MKFTESFETRSLNVNGNRDDHFAASRRKRNFVEARILFFGKLILKMHTAYAHRGKVSLLSTFLHVSIFRMFNSFLVSFLFTYNTPYFKKKPSIYAPLYLPCPLLSHFSYSCIINDCSIDSALIQEVFSSFFWIISIQIRAIPLCLILIPIFSKTCCCTKHRAK